MRKIAMEQADYTYSAYVIAGDFLFTSILGGSGANLQEQLESTLQGLSNLLARENLTLAEVVKLTLTIKKGQNFEPVKELFRNHFSDGFPARNTIIVDKFLNDTLLCQLEAVAYLGK